MFGITAFAQAPFAALGGATFAVSLDETFTNTDAYGSTVAFSGIYVESFALSDADAGATFNYFLNTVENFSLDTTEGNISVYDLALAESFTTTETLLFGFSYPVNLAESFSLTDAPDVTSLFIASLNETMTVSEDLTGGFFYGVDTTDSATLTEVTTVQTNFGPTVAETITAVDTLPATAIYNSGLLEAITLTDSQIGRGWFRIVDDQNPNWVQINDDQ